ncbi:MAG: TonB-dependent receptor [Prevotellaceae bacterium]|nr:TonB-dependent receptor [Prevotellaceae bacterium]
MASTSLWAQDLNVSGTVRDGNGDPVVGASVVVKGSTRGATTGVGGSYDILAPADATLVFSFMGLATKEEPVSGRGRIDMVLSEEDKALDEVVVIGYGTQRREAVTGSVASIGGESMRAVQSTNFTQALQGRIAGVEMAQTSTQPGATMQIRIRGTRSLTASNDPLVVLDGIPFAGSIGDINPSDIKSIDILKDASATAIYGSRGANGVIIVTTNRGVAGQDAQVTYNGYHGVRTVFAKAPMMDGPKFVKLRAAAGLFTNGTDEFDDVSMDWQDQITKNGMVTSHDVGVSGGTGSGAYNFGVGYYLDEGVVPLQSYNRISLRASIDQGIGKHFRFGVTTNNNYSVSNGSQIGMWNPLSMSPIANPYNDDGSMKRTVNLGGGGGDTYFITRDLLESLEDKWVSRSTAFASYNNLYGEVKIPGVEGLKYRANLGLNFRMTHGGGFTGEGINNASATTPSTASVSNSLTTGWAIENLLTYDRTFAEKHNVNVVALYSAEQTSYNRSRMAARDIPNEVFQYFNLGAAAGEKTIDPDEQEYNVSGLTSYMGRAMYSYDDRYMVSATFRSDASSRLAPGYKWHSYPALSAGWNISEESFMESVSAIDKLKLRAGYGQTSNQAVEPYATLGLLSTRPYNFGNIYETGYYVSDLPNPALGWEYSETWNFGVDFSLLKNRLSGTLEYYVQNTKDILLHVDLPSTSGVSSGYMANIGKTQNKGFELSLNGVILNDLNGWTWEAGINFYANRNKLVALTSGQERDEGNSWFVGYPIDVIYDYEKLGLWNETDPDWQHAQILEPGVTPGTIKVKYTGDYNADGTPARNIGPDDRQIMSIEPDFQGGLNTRVAYKDFDLNVVGAFKSGGLLISTLYVSGTGYLNLLTTKNNNVDVDYWTPENTGAKYPNPAGLRSGDGPKYGSTLGYFDASYLKIRAITLGYNFSPKWTKPIGVDRFRLYATVQNPLVLFSPYHSESGMDPETNSYGDENVASNEFKERLLIIGTNSPSTRSYLFGLSLTF